MGLQRPKSVLFPSPLTNKIQIFDAGFSFLFFSPWIFLLGFLDRLCVKHRLFEICKAVKGVSPM